MNNENNIELLQRDVNQLKESNKDLQDGVKNLEEATTGALGCVNNTLNEFRLAFVEHRAQKEACADKCEKTHKVVFGMLGVGVKPMILALWGLGAAILSLLVKLTFFPV